MAQIEQAGRPPQNAARPRWSEVLRALRDARGVTLDGWGARLGVSRKTVQRWERGERAPDPGAEAAILTYCRETSLFRSYDRGPLAGLSITAELLQNLLAEARWHVHDARVEDAPSNGALPAGRRPGPADDAQRPPASNLPVPLTSFVGREREIATVRRLQAGTRLFTLAGVGGVGKTRLLLELARELLWAYPHGVWLVELAALADPALVPETVAAALGLQSTGSRPVLEDASEFLRGRHLLLLLDNCEHLSAACALLTEALLRASPALEVIATSREPLGVAGEIVWRVPPMDVSGSTAEPPDAVRLFVERARAHRPEFELTAESAAAVSEICGRLDGIPLALELAAARVKVLSVDQLAARLEDRFQLLTGGIRTALPRHQTLRAALDWSHELLAERERVLFRRLSVFAGGFTLEAAEAICGEMGNGQWAMEAGGVPLADRRLPNADVLDLLTSLVDKSLVISEEQGGGVRHRLLETIRQYTAEKLGASGELEEMHERHLAWFLALAETADGMMRGPQEAEWLARLEREHDNLRAALRWSLRHGSGTALRLASALVRLWESRGHVAEGQAWLTEALAAAGDAPITVRARALRAAGALAETRGEFAAARALHEQALDFYRRARDERGIAEGQASLGWALYRQGDYPAARAALSASLALYRELGYKPGIASAQGTLGLIAQRQGDHATAQALMEDRLAINRELGDRCGVADALEDLATLAGERGDAARQIALLEESLALFRELGDTHGVALTLGSLGMALWACGERDRAAGPLQESLTLHRQINERRGIARLLAYQGMVALYEQGYARSEALCRESLELYHALGDAWAIGRYLPVLAAAIFRQGDAERAARLLGAAASLRARLGTPLPPAYQSDHDRALAALRRALGEPAFAIAWQTGEAMAPEEALGDARCSNASG